MINAVIAFIGLAIIAVGVGLVYMPAGLIVAGLGLIAAAFAKQDLEAIREATRTSRRR